LVVSSDEGLEEAKASFILEKIYALEFDKEKSMQNFYIEFLDENKKEGDRKFWAPTG
jgi:hypothetical protein